MSAEELAVGDDEENTTEMRSTEPVEIETEELVRDLVTSHNRLEDRLEELDDRLEESNGRIEELERENREQSALIDALRTQNEQLKTVLAGSVDEFSTWEPDEMVPMHARLLNVEDDLEEHDDKLRMMVVDDGKKGSPDERAMHLRQVLYNEGKQLYKEQDHDGSVEAKLSRDRCSAALGSTVQRGTVLDAMKRAADGRDASDRDAVGYTPIQGASSLEPMDAISFHTGASVNNSGETEQSHIRIRLDSLTMTDVRKNLTTVSEGNGGEV